MHCRYNLREISKIISLKNNGSTNQQLYQTFQAHAAQCEACQRKKEELTNQQELQRRMMAVKARTRRF